MQVKGNQSGVEYKSLVPFTKRAKHSPLLSPGVPHVLPEPYKF